MLIQEYKVKGYDTVELIQGVRGDGGNKYGVYTSRTGEDGRRVSHTEWCQTEAEACHWVKHCL